MSNQKHALTAELDHLIGVAELTREEHVATQTSSGIDSHKAWLNYHYAACALATFIVDHRAEILIRPVLTPEDRAYVAECRDAIKWNHGVLFAGDLLDMIDQIDSGNYPPKDEPEGE